MTNHTPSQIRLVSKLLDKIITTDDAFSWVGSIQLMLTFTISLLSGMWTDAGYFHILQLVGGALFSFSYVLYLWIFLSTYFGGLFMLSLAKPGQYYQVRQRTLSSYSLSAG